MKPEYHRLKTLLVARKNNRHSLLTKKENYDVSSKKSVYAQGPGIRKRRTFVFTEDRVIETTNSE